MSRLSASVWHHTVLGTDPTPEQLRLYNSWPTFKGFSDNSLDPTVAEAVIILALRSGSGNDQVLVLAPQAAEQWLLEQFEAVAIRSFQWTKERYPTRAKEMINGFIQLFRKVKMTGRVLQLREEPAHWVSFGFLAESTLAPWMDGRLLERNESRRPDGSADVRST
jgi:hypothetical protein